MTSGHRRHHRGVRVAMLFRILMPWMLVVVCCVLAGYTGIARAQVAAAQVASLRGSARAISRDEIVRPLRIGASVFAGERVETGGESAISLRFSDGTRFELGERSRFRINAYSYGPGQAQESITTRVLAGVFRFVSGLIARRTPSAMRVQLSVASVGIRGTSVAGEVAESSARVMLLEPEEPGAATAIEVSNQFGSVTIDEPGFGTEIPDAFSPPSPPRRMRMNTVQNLIRSLQQIQRIRPPRLR